MPVQKKAVGHSSTEEKEQRRGVGSKRAAAGRQHCRSSKKSTAGEQGGSVCSCSEKCWGTPRQDMLYTTPSKSVSAMTPSARPSSPPARRSPTARRARLGASRTTVQPTQPHNICDLEVHPWQWREHAASLQPCRSTRSALQETRQCPCATCSPRCVGAWTSTRRAAPSASSSPPSACAMAAPPEVRAPRHADSQRPHTACRCTLAATSCTARPALGIYAIVLRPLHIASPPRARSRARESILFFENF